MASPKLFIAPSTPSVEATTPNNTVAKNINGWAFRMAAHRANAPVAMTVAAPNLVLAAAATPLYVDHLVNAVVAAVMLADALAKVTLSGVVTRFNAPCATAAALDATLTPVKNTLSVRILALTIAVVPMTVRFAALNPLDAIAALAIPAVYLASETTATPPMIFASAPKFAPTVFKISAIPWPSPPVPFNMSLTNNLYSFLTCENAWLIVIGIWDASFSNSGLAFSSAPTITSGTILPSAPSFLSWPTVTPISAAIYFNNDGTAKAIIRNSCPCNFPAPIACDHWYNAEFCSVIVRPLVRIARLMLSVNLSTSFWDAPMLAIAKALRW